jgi:adenine phosphoribosyltransferase
VRDRPRDDLADHHGRDERERNRQRAPVVRQPVIVVVVRAKRLASASVTTFHDELVSRLRHFEGHFDTLGLFADGDFLRRAGAAVAGPFRSARVQKVAGVEARGFVLAVCVALELNAGFVAIRKPGSIHPGPKIELPAPADWRGLETTLRLQRHVVAAAERVLVVDDWAETGSKALTARRLIEASGGVYAGLSLLVDQLPEAIRENLQPVAAVALAKEVRA